MAIKYDGPNFGGFDADLQGSSLIITVGIFWEWKPAIQNVFGQAEPNHLEWKEQDKREFKASALESIPEAWDGKWKFRHLGTGQVITPTIRVRDAASKQTASITFSVTNGGGVAGLVPADKTVNLFNTDHEDNSSQRYMVQQWEHRLVENVVKANGAAKNTPFGPLELMVPVTRAGAGVWSIDNTSPAHQSITNVAQRLRARSADSYKPQVQVTGSSGNSTKARAMARPVAQFFEQKLGRGWQVLSVVNKTKKKYHNPFTHQASRTGSVSVSLSEPPTANNQLGQSAFHRYRVVDHEFGHCLGLPDEYMTSYPGDIGTAAHRAWYDMCDAAMVPKNVASDSAKTRSMMSAGWQVHRCHYVTIWDALRVITGDDRWKTV